MTSASATVDGAERLSATLSAAGDALADLAAVNREQGTATLNAAAIPVRTGQLQRSAYVDSDAQGFALSASAPYAGIVHAANPFFTRALAARADHIIDALVDHAGDVLDTIHGA